MRTALGYCRNSVLSRCLQNAYGAQTIRVYSRRAASVNEDLQNVLHRKTVLPETQKFSDGVAQLIGAYREHGHKLASVDPLGLWQPVREVPELHPAMYGFSGFKDDISVNGFLGLPGISSVGELVAALQNIYCSTLSAEFQHLQTLEERLWFAEKFEHVHKMNVPVQKRKEIAKLLSQTQAFDNFLANKFPTLKRYGGEGAEGNLVFVNEILHAAIEDSYSDAVICMPHRGRLNVLALNLNYDPSYMFLKINGKSEFPEGVTGYGDVLSHLFTTVDLDYGQGRKLHVSMIPNPSHLEANNPVAVGKARGRQQKQKSGEYSKDDVEKNKVLCVQIHGDASFTGQGIVPETFVFANLPRYTVGGSVHFITNNQVGFTTPGSIGRSSTYASDIAKMNACPVLHVNGDCPEDVLRATRLAFDYKNKFGKDIVIDMVCYRLHGHNEVDDPTFTQPVMYGAIQSRKSLPDTYTENLLREGVLAPEESKAYSEDYTNYLREKFSSLSGFKPKAYHLQRQWSGLVQAGKNNSVWDTGFPVDGLKFVGSKSVEFPGTFNIHPHLLKTHVKSRLEKLKEGRSIDWATAEALAIGSLLLQGFSVRISGQDVGRGTFSHRHALLTDQQTNLGFVPLNHMHENQEAFYEVANSVLSEEAVLGFEYGMSIEDPNRLVIWEAQFGDFFTGAQIIIDTYISSGETKWLLQSGLVMLLPHGYDGAGPEHSSCRIERFLQQTDSSETSVDGDNVNFSFVNATTPTQYFHLLRRQMLRNYRKPLVVAAPKTVLRLPAATSQLNEMGPGKFFSPVLPDATADPSKVDKVVFVSGKHYYALDNERKAKKMENTALVRVEEGAYVASIDMRYFEELCPFPAEGLRNEIKKYPKAKQFIWAQEEPRNMGAWTFVQPRLQNLLGINAKYAGRPELPLPAVGIGLIHDQQVKDILQQVFQ